MLKAQIIQWFEENKEQMIKDLQTLVNINSISVTCEGEHMYGEGCAQVLDAMLSLGEKHGFTSEYADYYGGRVMHKGEIGDKTVGLWGHLDIVPHGDDWVFPKYEMTNTGKFLVGRGVSDNKNACIQDLYAIKCLRDLGVKLKNNYAVYVGWAEETGMSDIKHIIDKFGYPDFSIVTDAAFPVCHGEKGIFTGTLTCDKLSDEILDINAGLVSNSLPAAAYIIMNKKASELPALPDTVTVEDLGDTVKLSAKGIACHAAFPERGLNAIGVLLAPLLKNNVFNENDSKYFKFLHALGSTYDGSALNIAYSDEESGPLTCVASVARKDGKNFTISLNIRYSVTIDDENMISTLTKTAGENGFVLTESDNSKPYYIPVDTWYIKDMMRIYKEMTDDDAPSYVMGGGTYARKLKNAVGFGPGMPTDKSELNLPEGHGAGHMADEAISIENFIKTAVIYTLALFEIDEKL